MDAFSIVSDSDSCDSTLTATASVIHGHKENERLNKEMLQKFMGIRPVRRHASMRNKNRSAPREIECRMEEEESIESYSSIVCEEEIRKVPDDIVHASDDNDDWSCDGVRSLPSTIVLYEKEQQVPIESCVIVQPSKSFSSSTKVTARPKRRFSSLASKFACLTYVAGISRHKRNELDESLHYDCSTSDDESEGTAPQQTEDKYASFFAVFDSDFNMNSNANDNDYYRRTVRGMECMAPCDTISLDSDVYELSFGSFEEEEQSARTPF